MAGKSAGICVRCHDLTPIGGRVPARNTSAAGWLASSSKRSLERD